MGLKPTTYDDPKVGPVDGDDRIFHVPFAVSSVTDRRGGKAVDLHHRYQIGTANSSNLAGFLEVDEIGTASGHPTSVADGDNLPVNFGLQKTHAFPTSGRVATVADVGKDFDISVDANNVMYVNLSAVTKGVLRVTKLLDASGNWVACGIPPDLRHGNL